VTAAVRAAAVVGRVPRTSRAPDAAAVFDALREVADPEIPVISVVDLGVIGDVSLELADPSSCRPRSSAVLRRPDARPSLREPIARARSRGRGRGRVRSAVDHRADHAPSAAAA
jgi:hypothetical protein